MICPCQMQQANPKAYANCCQVFHDGKPAKTPELLMRSRFSAYVLGLSDYIARTWHVSTCPQDLQLSPDDQWLKLDIAKANGTQVHFRAYFKDGTDFYVLDEISDFKQENNHWVYVSGKTQTHTVQLGRNDTCLCGSGKKFKKCCADNKS